MRLKSSTLAIALLAVLSLAVLSVKAFVREVPEPTPSEIVSNVPPSGNGSGNERTETAVSTDWPSAPADVSTSNPLPSQQPVQNFQPSQAAQQQPVQQQQQPVQAVATAPAQQQSTATQPTQRPAVVQQPSQAPVSNPATALPSTPPAPTQNPVVTTASGSFSSDTGTFLNLKVDWKTYTDAAGNAKMQVNLSATSYSFNTDAMFNALELSVNGTVYTANSPSIHLTDSTKFVTTPLTSFLLDAPSGGVILKATWHYKGSYSGVALDDIVASANLFL